MSSSKPRPIHMLSRDIRQTPDQSEPSFSFEDRAFMAGQVGDVEDEFHRRLIMNNQNKQQQQQQKHRDSSIGGDTNSNSLPSGSPAAGGSILGSNSGAQGSFWRTDSVPLEFPSQPVTLKERKTSGGLLGAAMQLHSLSSHMSEETSSSKIKGGSSRKPDNVRNMNEMGGLFF